MKETKFKQTEVGMIPSDWEVTTIGDFCKVYDGTHQTPNYVDFGIPFYSVENVSADDFEHTKYISLKEYTQISKRANIVKGDILMTRIGSIGVCKYVDWNCKAGFYVSLALLKCNDSVDARFICHLSNSENFKREIELHSLLTAIPQKINLGPISNVRIALPPTIEEQQRIANALSDVDSLINNLEKLIAKKKNIKQGAMQQLLTGKKRLPGFGSDERRKECHSERSAKREAEKSSGYKMTELGLIPSDWENVNISKTCTIKARIGWQGLKSTEYLNSGDYILVTGTDFKNGFIDWSTCSYVSEWRFKQDKNIQIKKGDVLVTKDGTIGKVAFLNEIPMEGTLNSGVFVVRSKDLKKIDSVYLSLVFKSSWFDNFLDEITSGSTIVHLYQKDFVKFNFPIPSSIEEQTAIANVLSDMDTEISALETKLAKYRTLKTGMKQQLLTGKIRLIDAKPEKASVENNRVVPVAFKRAVLAAEIAHRLCAEPTFGHVKMEKMLFLAEKMCELDINSSYHRDAAGPYDNRALRSVDSQLEKQKWFKFIRSDKGNHYIPLEKRGGHSQYFDRYYSECRSVFDSIISTFKTAKTEQCEIVATLYSAWEDFLNQGANPTDDQIVTEVLTNWNESKKRISKERWIKALLWMKENKFTPLKQVL